MKRHCEPLLRSSITFEDCKHKRGLKKDSRVALTQFGYILCTKIGCAFVWSSRSQGSLRLPVRRSRAGRFESHHSRGDSAVKRKQARKDGRLDAQKLWRFRHTLLR